MRREVHIRGLREDGARLCKMPLGLDMILRKERKENGLDKSQKVLGKEG